MLSESKIFLLVTTKDLDTAVWTTPVEEAKDENEQKIGRAEEGRDTI